MANTELGSAYVTIMPEMKGFMSSVGKELSSSGSAFGSLGKAATGAAKAAAAGFAALTGAVSMVGGAALNAYADYEQLTGGVQKLFGDASDAVMSYAKDAYRTAGMSANQYMEQATSFSAALIQSLAGDTAKAADYADLAMRTMSDNVNVFGSNMEDVQNAFQGFAKQNYTMLDNLKLGYGGTQAEMKRLIKDANKLPGVMRDGADLTIDSYADVIEAIARVQKAQGIAGTTAKEAATTISGSIGMAKAAWENFLTGLADPDADFSALTTALLDSIGAVARNVAPRVAQIGKGIVDALPGALAGLGDVLLPIVSSALSSAWNIAVSGLGSLGIELPPVDAMAFLRSVDKAGQMAQGAVALWNMGEDIPEKLHLEFEYAKNLVRGAMAEISDIVGIDMGEVASKIAVAAGSFGAFKAASTVVPALSGLSGKLSGIAGTVGNLSMAMRGIPVVDPGIAKLSSALSKLVSPATVAVAGIAALAAAFAYFYATNDGFRETINSIGSTMMSLLMPALQSIGTTVGNLASAVLPMVQSAAAAIAPVIMQVLTALAQVAAVLIPLIAQVVATVLPVIATVVQTVVQAATSVITTVMPVIESIMSAVLTAMPAILAIVTSVLTLIMGIFSAVWPAVQAIVEAAMSVIQGVIDTVWPAIQAVIDTVMNGIKVVIFAVMQAINGDWEGAWNTISTFLSGVWEGIKSAVSAGIDGVVGFFSDLPGNILGALGDLGSLLWNAGSSIIDGLWGGLKSAWGNVTSWFSEITSMIPNLKGPLPVDAKLLVTNGEAIMGGLMGGLMDGWDDVESYLSSRTARIPGAFGDAPYRGTVDGGTRGTTNNVYIDGARLNASEQVEQAVSMLVESLVRQYDMGIA